MTRRCNNVVTRFAVVACALLACLRVGAAQNFQEYQLKAVFLYNFAQFVQWAPSTTASNAPFVIGVLGEDPFDGYLDETVNGEQIDHRPFVVKRYRSIQEIDACNILFVSASEAAHIKDVLAGIKGRPILTVSDIGNFAELGGIVQFVTKRRHIKLRINVDAAKAADLTISSKLLRPAQIVYSGAG